MNNKQIANILREIGLILELDEVAFKPRAYERAAQSIEVLGEEVADIYHKGGQKALDGIPGVGKSIAGHIAELVDTGKMKYYKQLKKKFPVDFIGMTDIEGVGPKMVVKLYKKLKIKNIKDLERAARAGKIAELAGFGGKTEKNILEGITFVKSSHGRFLLGEVLPIAEKIRDKIAKVPGVKKCELAGSIRRRRETIGDIDLVVSSTKPKEAIKAFTSMPEVKKVVATGPTKALVRLKAGLDADLRVMKEAEYGSGLLYFTGNKFHNIAIRKIAIKKKLKLNEYGLFRGKKQIVAKGEEEIYKKLGLQYMPPELRTNTGEIEVALHGKIPEVIPYGSIKGDLQIQTNWSDGTPTIAEYAKQAKEIGLEYIAITDHTRVLAMANGLDERRLAAQGKEIDKLNKKLRGFKVLKSAEINILKDGKLDIKDSALVKLDLVSVAVHSHFNLSEAEMTERIIRAMKNPYVHILFHPTGRLINKRPAYKLDIEKIIKAAKQHKVALEINGAPERLDLRDSHVRMAIDKKVKLVINSDAHTGIREDYLEYGISQARRGWARKSDVLNTKSLAQFLKSINK